MRRTVRRAIVLALCDDLIPSTLAAQSLGEQVIGTWTLLSWTRFVGDTQEPLPWGRDPIMRRDRAWFASLDLLAGHRGRRCAASR
jgi:hypothetical protein